MNSDRMMTHYVGDGCTAEHGRCRHPRTRYPDEDGLATCEGCGARLRAVDALVISGGRNE